MKDQTLKPILMKINIPFTAHKPSFIDRDLVTGRDTHQLNAYALALAVEIEANAPEFEDCCVQAIRFGYGSASILNGSDTEKLCRLIRQRYHVSDDLFISMRTCPADINGANMPFYNRTHINRYDLEMFSLEPQDHPYLHTLNYMEQIPYISAGFLKAEVRYNMGFILLYGKKSRAKWGFRRSVLETVRRPVSHVVLQRCAGEDVADESSAAAELSEASELLTEHGYHEYLPGRWAKEGCEDPFWSNAPSGKDVLGFGTGATTSFDGAVTVNTTDLSLYMAHSGEYERITVEAYKRS